MMIFLLILPVWRIAHVQKPPGGGSTGLVISWHDVPHGTTKKNIEKIGWSHSWRVKEHTDLDDFGPLIEG